MIKNEYYLIVSKNQTLNQIQEIIYADSSDEGFYMLHWTQTLDSWSSLDAAKRALELYANSNQKRIVKYTEILEELK